MSKAEAAAIRGYEHPVRVDDRGVEQYLELPRELRSIYARAGVQLRLTDQCSCACVFCINSKKGNAYNCISQDAVLTVVDDAIRLSRASYYDRMGSPSDVFYDNTDVGDWLRLCGDPQALNELVSRSAWSGRFVGLSTAVPPGAEHLLAQTFLLMENGGLLYSNNVAIRVSRGQQNKRRVEQFLSLYTFLGGAKGNLRIEERTPDNIVKQGITLHPEIDNPLHCLGITSRDTLVIAPGGFYAKYYAANTAHFSGGQATFSDPTALPFPYPQDRFTRKEPTLDSDALVWTPDGPDAIGRHIDGAEASLLNAGRYLISLLDKVYSYARGMGVTMQTPNDAFWQTVTPYMRQSWSQEELRVMRSQIAEHLEYTSKDPVLSAYLEQFLKV